MTYNFTLLRRTGSSYKWSPRALVAERSIASSPGGWLHTTPVLAASMYEEGQHS